LVHQSSEKNIFERTRKNSPFTITWCAQKCSEASGGTLLCDIICAEAPLYPTPPCRIAYKVRVIPPCRTSPTPGSNPMLNSLQFCVPYKRKAR
jgi:hypothetical protein